MFWRIPLLVLAYLLLAAHFMRFGAQLPMAVLALAPVLLFVRKRWAIQLLQVGLVIGVVAVWFPSTLEFINQRQSVGAPWLRLAAIMGGVMLFTLSAAWAIHPLWRDAKPKG